MYNMYTLLCVQMKSIGYNKNSFKFYYNTVLYLMLRVKVIKGFT